jgi:hypothetical protein
MSVNARVVNLPVSHVTWPSAAHKWLPVYMHACPLFILTGCTSLLGQVGSCHSCVNFDTSEPATDPPGCVQTVWIALLR